MAAMPVPPSRLLLLLAMALWMSPSMLLPAAMADHTGQQPASPSVAAQQQPHLPPAGPSPTTAATLPAATTSSPAAAAADPLPTATPAVAPSETTTAAAAGAASTAPQKFPLPPQGGGAGEPVVPGQGVGVPGEPGLPAYGGGGAPYNPVAEVAGALPVPTPDELPSGASLGFGQHGGLGYGGPGDECCGGPGGYGWFGGPGGFGPGTYGYSGPLYWGAATAAAGLGRVTNILLPLLVASISAAIFA